MKLPTRTPEGPVLVGEFPTAEIRQTVADLIKERDTAEGAAMYADEERAAAEKECDRIAEQRDAAIVERDELTATALPLLIEPALPTNTEPVDALIYEQLKREYPGWV